MLRPVNEVPKFAPDNVTVTFVNAAPNTGATAPTDGTEIPAKVTVLATEGTPTI